MSDVLHYLPFNLGPHESNGSRGSVRVPRGAVPDDAVEALRAVLDAEEGALPGFEGWFLDLRQSRDQDGRRRNGSAYFQFAEEPGASRTPALMGFACWHEDLSPETWDQAQSAYHALRPALEEAGLWRAPPRRLPGTPWLATWLTPFAVGREDGELAALSGIARATGWALAGR